MTMTALSVNLNKVAMLRNQRDLPYPSVVEFARISIAAGAHGITVHPRPDERHVRKSDVPELSAMLRTDHPNIEYNIEGYPTEDFLVLCESVKPDQVTLVPDAPDQRTSDHGWIFAETSEFLRPIIARLKAGGMRVSVFVDAEPGTSAGAKAVGADRIEIYTEPFADAFGTANQAKALADAVTTATEARELGLGVNAGHDLSLDNLSTLIRAIPWTLEVSIGHAITADALKIGFTSAVKAYLVELEMKRAA
jgi:pyridoxine 5-phosphate synthase